MSTKIDAWQKPCVGRRLNWQGHPHSQLQLTISVPWIVQSGSGIAANSTKNPKAPIDALGFGSWDLGFGIYQRGSWRLPPPPPPRPPRPPPPPPPNPPPPPPGCIGLASF